MGEVRVSLTNFLTVGLMAFTFVWGANKLLQKVVQKTAMAEVA